MKIIAFAILFLSSLVRGQPDARPLPTNLLRDAETAYFTRDFEKALSIYSGIIEEYPKVRWLYVARAHQHFSLGQYEQAIDDLSTALSTDSTFGVPTTAGDTITSNFFFPSDEATILIERAGANVQLKRFELALKDFDQSVEVDSALNIFIQRGSLYEKLGRYQKAIEDFDIAIRKAPNFSAAYEARGVCYARMKDYPRAIRDLRQAVGPNGMNLSAKYNLAYALLRSGDETEAECFMNEIIEKRPERPEGYFGRALIAGNRERYEEAVFFLDIVLFIKQDSIPFLTTRAFALKKLEKYPEAIDDLDAAIGLDPGSSFTNYARGETYFVMGKDSQAIQDYSSSLRLDPDNVPAFYSRGLAHFYSQKFDDALCDFQIAMEKGFNSSTVHKMTGSSYARLNDFGNAIWEYARAIELDGNNPVLHNNIGYYYFELGDITSAEVEFRKCISLDSTFWDSFLGLAIVQFEAGNLASCRNYLTEATKIQPLLMKGMEGVMELGKQSFYSNRTRGTLQKMFAFVAR